MCTETPRATRTASERARLYRERRDRLLPFEGRFMNQRIEPRGAPEQVTTERLASRFVAPP